MTKKMNYFELVSQAEQAQNTGHDLLELVKILTDYSQDSYGGISRYRKTRDNEDAVFVALEADQNWEKIDTLLSALYDGLTKQRNELTTIISSEDPDESKEGADRG